MSILRKFLHSLSLKIEFLEVPLRVDVQTGAKKDDIVGEQNNYLKIRVKAQPIAGKANEYLVKFLAKEFGVTKREVLLTKGPQSKYKQFQIKSPLRLPLDIMPDK